MRITNDNIRSLLRWGTMGLAGIALADVIIAQTPGMLGEIFKGYSALVVPTLLLGTYAYVGLPIFHFNADSEILHIKSHLGLSEFLGKELYVPKKNIIKFEIDRKRIRKKLTVHYLKDGNEFRSTFSITLLNNKKIERLARKVELIHSEVRNPSGGYHLFI